MRVSCLRAAQYASRASCSCERYKRHRITFAAENPALAEQISARSESRRASPRRADAAECYIDSVVSAATVNLDIHFLAGPEPADVIAQTRLLRFGRRLCVCSVCLLSSHDLVAHATVTYALPQPA